MDDPEVPTLEPAQSYRHNLTAITDIAWSADGAFVAACAEEAVVAWPATDSGPPRVLKTGTLGRSIGLAWHPGHHAIVIAFAEGTVAKWDINTSFARALAAAGGEATGVAWSPDGSRLAVTDADGGLGIWDATRTNRIDYSQAHRGRVGRPCWSPDSQSVVTHGDDGIAVSWAAAQAGIHPWIIRNSNPVITDIALSPGGDVIAAGASDRTVRIFAAANGAERAVLEGGLANASRVRFSPDCEFLAVASLDEVALWRCRDWEKIARIKQARIKQEGMTWSGAIDFHPSRPLLATAKNASAEQVRCYKLDYVWLANAAIHKKFLLEEKERGRLLSTSSDLFHSYCRANRSAAGQADLRANFDACIGRVASRGLITRLHFGDLVLLQPELLDSYASAMVQTAKEEPDGLGFIPEEEALAGRFRLAAGERVPDQAQEKLLLIATVEELLRHEIALKETTERGVDLIFPSQFTRERAYAPDVQGKQVIFTFEGPLRSIYARLAVRLSHSKLFSRQDMWQNTASYTAADGSTCGFQLRELEEGRGELALFYDHNASPVVRAQFENYILGDLQLRAVPGSVTSRRIQICPDCGYALPDDLIRRRLEMGAMTMRCPACDQSVMPLVRGEPPAAVGTAVAEMNRSADLRRDQNVAATRLQGKIQAADFDVFLCYHSKDRDQVTEIGQRLKERGILPWLDIWEIPPGARWQTQLKKQIRAVKTTAVFIGSKGPGPWQELEIQTILNDFAKRQRPVIPVILAGRQGNPRLPDFLNLWHIVDMRKQIPDPFEQLIWGITRQKPTDPA
jgi:hypothetical protein